MMAMLPTTDEIGLIKGYTGSVDDLAPPERFVTELIKIPDFGNRLKGLLFRENYGEMVYDLNSKITDMTKAFNYVVDSERFHHILEVALAVSNYLNGTGPRGGAWGIKLETVQRIE